MPDEENMAQPQMKPMEELLHEIDTGIAEGLSRRPVLNQRNKTHGSFEWNAFVSQRIKAVFRNCPEYDKFSDVHKEALDMIALKLSRLLQNPEFEDHWLDLAGYADLAREHVDRPNEFVPGNTAFVRKA